MHSDEMKEFQAKLEAFIRLQADEIKFLREELAALRAELAVREEKPTIDTQTEVEPVDEPEIRLNRREFLRGGVSRQES